MTPIWRRRLRKILLSLAGLLLLLWLADRLFPLPLQQLENATVVTAEDGTPLWRFADTQGVWRYPIRIDQVSPLYIEALLTYEDRWFYSHPGVNPLAMARAAWQNLSGGQIISGGSTLSMQVARLLDPHPKTLWGKLRQIWRTLQLEWHLSKTEILTLYLNRAPYGGTLQGIAAASWAYLGKPPTELTPAEAALLAVLPQAPSRLRPDRQPEAARNARDKVLKRLGYFGVWPTERITEALQEQVLLAPRRDPQLAPLLARRLQIEAPGALIHTGIDIALQRRLEDLLQGWRTRLPQKTSAAILVVDAETMLARAYIGSLDFDDNERFGQVDMVHALRSPGSTLKPFLYGLALDQGLIHSESLLLDVPRHYGDYRPDNFSSGFSGPVSASTALSSSLNLPAVQLLESLGPNTFVGSLQGAGLPLTLPGQSPPSLAVILGGVGTRLEHLVSGYSVFARQGHLAQVRLTPDQPLIEKPLLSAGSAWIIRRILSGQLRPDRDPHAQLVQRPVLAWKTGTSYGFRDAWAIGVGPRYLIGVWIGRPDGTPVPGQFGLATAAPLLLQVHDILVNRDSQRGQTGLPNPKPDSVGVARICWPLGQALTPGDPNCRRVRFAWTLSGTVPPTLQPQDQPLGLGIQQTLWVNKQGLQVDAQCPDAQQRQIALWPAALESWLPTEERRSARLPSVDPTCPPHAPLPATDLTILGLQPGDQLKRPASTNAHLSVQVSAIGGNGQRWWFLDGQAVNQTQGSEQLSITLEQAGPHQIGVLDENGLTAHVQFDVIP